MTLTKTHIVNHLLQSGAVSRNDAIRVVEDLIEIIKQRLEGGEDLLVSGFGKFVVKDKRARRGRNPHTGTDLTLAPRKVVTFHASGVLRDRINGK